MQILAQLRKTFEENIHEVGEGYFCLSPESKKQRRGKMLASCSCEFWHAYVR